MTTAEIQVAPATPAEAGDIARYNVLMAQESESLTLDPATVLAGVSRVFADASLGRYIVARSEGKVVGQLMLTLEWSDWHNGHYWWVQSVYVVPEFRRRGVFTSLLNFVVADAKRRGDVHSIRLYVEEENTRAQGTYARVGFAQTGYQVLELPV